MAEKKIRIIHIDTGIDWRGGQQQAYYLHQKLTERKIFSLMICNKYSELFNRCKKNNLPVIAIKMFGEADVMAAFKISKICKKEKINIIQCHSSHSQTLGIFARLFNRNVKLFTVRRVDFSIKKNLLSIYKYNTKLIDRIICVSNGIKNILIEDHIYKDKLITIHDGIPLNKFTKINRNFNLKKYYSIRENNIIVGTVAAFVGHKDYPNLINAAKIVLNQTENVTFIFTGTGPLKLEMENLVEKLGLARKIIFAGFRENIEDYIASFDIFVLSSKQEGLGSSLLDAQGAGVPVISTNTGGIPEIIEHNNNGILVEKEKSSQLAKAILDLVNNPERRKNLSKNALKSVGKFSIENIVDNYINLYKEILFN